LGEQGHGLGADVVYECAGRSEAVALSVQAVRPSGTVVVVGMSGKSGSVATSQLLERQLTLRASLGYTVTDVHRALDLMADDRFRVSAIHERLVGFDELASAFASLSTDSSARRKVLFSPTP
jgi:threonine dehydrogenase-like Zn-dependent dehydrogenase